MENKSVKITLSKDNVKTEYKEGKEAVSKNISVKELIGALSCDVVFRTGIMSPGIRYYSRRGDREFIVVETPPKIRQIRNERFKDGRVTVPTPPTVFFFILRGGRLMSSKCYCIKKPLSKNNQTLYHFPLGNMSRGEICWGGARKQIAKYDLTLSNINTLVEVFYSSSFNNDLSMQLSIEGRRIVGCESPAAVLRYLEGKKEFPMKILHKEMTTARGIISSFERSG